MFNDSAHSKRNHKRNFPSFSLPISKYNFACDFFDLLFVFVPRRRKNGQQKQRKKLFIFLKSFSYSFAGYQTIIKFIFEIHIFCVFENLILFSYFFPLKFFRFIIFQQFSVCISCVFLLLFCWWLSNF